MNIRLGLNPTSCYVALVPSKKVRIISRPRKLALLLGFLLASAFFFLTSAEPWVPVKPAATAQQVQAARKIFGEARHSRTTGKPSDLSLSAADLDDIAVMVSQGFAPNRLEFRLRRDILTVTASRPFLSRWINVRIKLSGRSVGFPELRATVGSIRFPAWLSRMLLELGRQLLAIRGASPPPLDKLVQSTSIVEDTVNARILLPRGRIIDQTLADDVLILDPSTIANIYCRLTEQQRTSPDPLFAHQLQRAISAAEPSREQHGAALVALAMLVADPRVDELVGEMPETISSCKIPVASTTLQGRKDWSKHWSMSAALTVATGSQFAAAMGAWKELSDSVSKRPNLARNDPSGFSFADLAADRAGILAARQLTDAALLGKARRGLLQADDEQLLPKAASRLDDGMSNTEFVRHFGGTDDPRYLALIKSIEDELRKGWVD